MRLRGDLSLRINQGPEFFPGGGPVDAEDEDDDEEDDDEEDGQEEKDDCDVDRPTKFHRIDHGIGKGHGKDAKGEGSCRGCMAKGKSNDTKAKMC